MGLPKVLHVASLCRSNSSLDSGGLKSTRTALAAVLRAEVMPLGCRREHSPCGISRASHNVVVIKKSAAGKVSWEVGTSKYEKKGQGQKGEVWKQGAPSCRQAVHTPVWAESSLLTLTLPSRDLRL